MFEPAGEEMRNLGIKRPVDWIADSQEDSQLHGRWRTNVDDPGI
jgi:hypothetical protein